MPGASGSGRLPGGSVAASLGSKGGHWIRGPCHVCILTTLYSSLVQESVVFCVILISSDRSSLVDLRDIVEKCVHSIGIY